MPYHIRYRNNCRIIKCPNCRIYRKVTSLTIQCNGFCHRIQSTIISYYKCLIIFAWSQLTRAMPTNKVNTCLQFFFTISHHLHAMEDNLALNRIVWNNQEWCISRDGFVGLQHLYRQLQFRQTIYLNHIIRLIYIYSRHLAPLRSVKNIITCLIGHLQKSLATDIKWQSHCIVNTRMESMFHW